MKKVVKFGGSSLASAEQFKKVGEIIRADESRRYVVPSAPGKRFSADTKVTDMLYTCYDAAVKDKKFTAPFNEIKSRYNLKNFLAYLGNLHRKKVLCKGFLLHRKFVCEEFFHFSTGC